MMKEAVLEDVVFHGKLPNGASSATALLKDDNGNIEKVTLWYDRKFEGVGLRIGDRLRIQLTKWGQWTLKNIVAQSEVDTPVVFPDGIFPNRQLIAEPVDKVAQYLVP